MAATFTASESTSTGPTKTDTSYLNFLVVDEVSGSDTTTEPNNHPIVIPAAGTNYSYERWCQGHWTGSFTTISNVTFYKKSGSLPTGVTIEGADRGSQTYTQSVITHSTIATTDSTSWDVVGEAFTLGYATNYSDYVVMQLHVANTATQTGTIGTMTYTFGWDEV